MKPSTYIYKFKNGTMTISKTELQNNTVAVIEDCETGKVFNVHPNNVQFIKD